MATRGAIFRKRGDELVGRYHHWDSYPEGLGATLFEWAREFGWDLERMMEFLIDRHPAGWSTIVMRKPFAPIGYGVEVGPECYCHGVRHDPPHELHSLDDAASCGAEWAYVIDPGAAVMEVWKRTWDDDDEWSWKLVATVSLVGPEPDWKTF